MIDLAVSCTGFLFLLRVNKPLLAFVPFFFSIDFSQWGLFAIGDNRIAWNINSQIAARVDLEEAKFKNTDWSPEARKDMTELVRDFKVPASYGGTLGALIDGTPSESVSQVFLEDKMFETRHHGRTVLIGEGKKTSKPCHMSGKVEVVFSPSASFLFPSVYLYCSLSYPQVDPQLRSGSCQCHGGRGDLGQLPL